MKKQKQDKARRPAKANDRNAKRVDPEMFDNSAPLVQPTAKQRGKPPNSQRQGSPLQNIQQQYNPPQNSQRQGNPPQNIQQQYNPPQNSQRQGSPQQGSPQLFDQSFQPAARQQPQAKGMQQTVLPMASQPMTDSDYDGQAPPKRRRKPQKAEKRLTRGEARRRRFRKKLLTFIILTMVIAAGITLSMTFLFKIESFVLDGTSTYSQQDLETAFGIAQGENIFSFDINKAESKMSEALPYAETVTVRRRLPSTIVFKTTEAVESYYTENLDGGYVILSAQLKVLRLSPEPPQDLPFLTGAEALLPKAGKQLESAAVGKLDGIRAAIIAIANEGLVPFSTLDVTNILEISFVYDRRAKVILGTANDLESKLALAGVILREKIGQFEKGTLDVSHKSVDKDRQGVWQPGNI